MKSTANVPMYWKEVIGTGTISVFNICFSSHLQAYSLSTHYGHSSVTQV